MTIETNLTEERTKRHHREGSWLDLTFPDLLEQVTRAFPDKIFITDSNKEVTYRQFDLAVRRLALHFLRLGVKKGTLISVQLPSSIEYFVAMMALMKIGAIHLPLPPRIGHEDLKRVTSLCNPVISLIPHEFGGVRYLPIYQTLRSKLPGFEYILVADGEADNYRAGTLSLNRLFEEPVEKDYPEDYLDQFKPSPTDLCLIQLTSGTTGLPKGAMHNHETCLGGPILGYQIAGRPDDIFLCLSPAFHTAGTTIFTLAMYYKCSMIIMDRFQAEKALELIEQKGVTILSGVPTHYADMLNVPDFEKYNLQSLRLALATAALMPPSLARKAEARLGCHLHIFYALTETKASGTFVLLTEGREEVRYNTLGKPTPYTQIKVVDDEDKEVAQGKPGEILIRGPGNFVGYYNDPELTQESLDEDEFFRTGDLGTVDRWGNITMTGRKKDLIIRGGENIYPKEIEDTLLKHPRIKDVAVIGAPNERLGEIVCACIVPEAGEVVTLEDAVSFLRGKIETHSLPEMVKIMDSLPRTESGKVLKAKIKQEIIKG